MLITGFVLWHSVTAFAQVTSNPRVGRKSADYVFVNKVEITDKNTVFSMQVVIKSPREALKDYLDKNPDQKQKLNRMDPAFRDMLLRGMMGEMSNTNTISFQPGSYLRSPDGRKFRFVKATDIPVAPERMSVESGKKYFFKLYFEKLPKGITQVDLIENSLDKDDSFVYWNIQDIRISNPGDGQEEQKETETLAYRNTGEFKLSGKVIDGVTGKPLPARILCYNEDGTEILDSVMTSRSGYYEFILPPDNYVYKVSSPGYENLEETLGLKAFRNREGFQKDIVLEPAGQPQQEAVVKEEILTTEVPELQPEKVEENKFRLHRVYFKLGESTVLEESFAQLDELASYLKENKELRIRIEGHTDNQGDPELNKKLSMERAYNVRAYLINAGIEGKRIEFKGYGSAQPVSPNNNEENRSKNRRVEYTILE